MSKFLKTAITAGLLIGVLALIGGCVPTATQPTEQNPNSTWYMIAFLVVIFALFYFVMIRPQRRRMKNQQTMMSSLQKGDKVITAGGIYGTIDSVREDSVVIKVEPGVMLRVAKGSVMALRDQQPQTR